MMRAAVVPLTILATALALSCRSHETGEIGAGPSAMAEPDAALFADDFESGALASWQDGFDPSRHRVATDGSAQSGSRYLATTYPAGRDGAWLTRFLGAGYDALYVSYYVRFPEEWRGGTKLIGFYGSRSDDRWSAMGKAGSCPTGSDFFAAIVVAEAAGDPGPMRFYTYYPAMAREPDGVTCWGRFGDGSETYPAPVAMSRGTWHRVEFAVTLNTPGRMDARQTLWLDGVERGSWSGFSFRSSDILRLNAVQLTFSADVLNHAREVHVDNVVVATRRP